MNQTCSSIDVYFVFLSMYVYFTFSYCSIDVYFVFPHCTIDVRPPVRESPGHPHVTGRGLPEVDRQGIDKHIYRYIYQHIHKHIITYPTQTQDWLCILAQTSDFLEIPGAHGKSHAFRLDGFFNLWVYLTLPVDCKIVWLLCLPNSSTFHFVNSLPLSGSDVNHQNLSLTFPKQSGTGFPNNNHNRMLNRNLNLPSLHLPFRLMASLRFLDEVFTGKVSSY